MRVFSLILLLFVFTLSYSQKGLSEYVSDWSDNSNLKHAHVGVAVYDIDSNKEIACIDGDKMHIPASSYKLITTLNALEILGDEYRYETVIGYTGKIAEDGTLSGDLVIKGSGDPTLGSERIKGVLSFNDLISFVRDEVKQYGITCIDGKVIADESIFDSYPVAPSWQWNDLGNYYAGGAWGININENEYKIVYNTSAKVGSAANLLYTDPIIPNLVLQNEVSIDSAHTGDNAYVFGGPYDYTKRIVGTLPQSSQSFTIKGSIPDPPTFFAEAVNKKLIASNIKTGGSDANFKKKRAYDKLEIISTIISPPLSQICQYANHYSINLYCEAILKTIGYHTSKEGSGGQGIRAITKLMNKSGLNTDALHMNDGSGLSARNLVSPSLLAQQIALTARARGIELLKKQLPKAGSQGTVRTFLNGHKAEGKVWAKSGSMEHILSYSGICQARSGKWVSFSIIVNGYNGSYQDMKSKCAYLVDAIYQKY